MKLPDSLTFGSGCSAASGVGLSQELQVLPWRFMSSLYGVLKKWIYDFGSSRPGPPADALSLVVKVFIQLKFVVVVRLILQVKTRLMQLLRPAFQLLIRLAPP